MPTRKHMRTKHVRRRRHHIGRGLGNILSKIRGYLGTRKTKELEAAVIPTIKNLAHSVAASPLAPLASAVRTRFDPMTSSYVAFGRRHRSHISGRGVGYRNY